MLLENVAGPLLVHITQADNIRAGAGDIFEVTPSLAADPDAGNI